MIKEPSPVEVNIDRQCIETFDSQISCAISQIKWLPNPYVGNKRKLLFTICNEIRKEHIKYDTVLDLFSGSASVSIVMKFLGKKVIANDLLASSCVYAKAFVENNGICLSDDEKKFLIKHQSNNSSDFVQEYYQDRFTRQEAILLDNFSSNILELKNSHNGILKSFMAIANLQVYIIDHCFVGGRLNRGQILADVDHRIAHNRNTQYLSGMKFHDICWYTFFCPDNHNVHSVCNLPAIEALDKYKNQHIDIAYVDPPYGGDQSDYVHMYKFFEEFYLGRKLSNTDPQIIHAKDFSNSKLYEEHFVAMIQALSYIPVIVLSYNDSSWADIDKVKDIISQFRDTVKVVVSENYKYKYRDVKNRYGKEYIIFAMGNR